ncbi:MAG: hypothetical protein WCA04_08550 [Geobacteraceae bacterium]
MHRSLWRFFSSINLSIQVLFAISFTLLIGSFYAKKSPAIYNELNFARFQEWLPVHGFASSWWLWLLFFLLALFGINTAICTSRRLLELLKARNEFRLKSFAVIISPSIMHLCFLAIIGGHALSQFSVETQQLPVHRGLALHLESGTLTVRDSNYTFRSEPGLNGILRSFTTRLTLSSKNGTQSVTVGLMEPASLEGYHLHLIPVGKASPGKLPEMKLVVKKDPGLAIILLSNLLLCMLMIWYFPIIIRNRKRTGADVATAGTEEKHVANGKKVSLDIAAAKSTSGSNT